MFRLFFTIFFLLVKPLELIYAADGIKIPQDHYMIMKQDDYDVLGIGAACIDLLIPVSDEFVNGIPGERGGAEAVEYEELNQIIKASGIEPYVATGGSCANTIKGLASLGIKCAFLSKIGTDHLGEHFTDYMKKLGVIPFFWKTAKPTARVLCLVTPDGQRTMRFFAGSSQEMTESHVHQDYIKTAKLVHIDSYSFRNGSVVEKMIQLAKESQALVSIDLSSFEIVRQYQDRLAHLLNGQIDIVFANEDEVRAMTGLDPYEGCRKLQETCPIAVVLMGKEGCLVGHRDQIFLSPAFPAHVVDTTGAGDLFASGFLFGYLKGSSLEQCARLGNLLGGAVIEATGTEIPEKKWENIRHFIDKELSIH